MREKLEQAIQTILEPYFGNIQFNEPQWEKVTKYPVVLIVYMNDERTLYQNNKVKHWLEYEIVLADRRLLKDSKNAEFDAIKNMEKIIDELDWKQFNLTVDDELEIPVLGRVISDDMQRRVFGSSDMYYGIVATVSYRCETIVPTTLHF